ncbi:MAG: (2Fe-2S) ferredoxin domain-containing protein [Candidatus Omnitrophica bacterium]|jgi:(2Fe-2S) ferredoxin|nr:(2Fe-2S) ferredoxin domain-containing protein [Candidatus Omnitrophota bacterium]MDD3274192.1 (2Fe-2S) ferredoxin domain-containing protein [Candidatus Omnitrophota bacterium]MDD5078066.1 (2Fe-2S) ferredoxin domain-containing protein [Candidatus Omnitrophota bacterium]MDD5725015.1 (2Fe-2S) ferredoxin domain-containing protein [Candidatus Omnitrophota bacterium]
MAKIKPADLDRIKAAHQDDGKDWIKVGMSTCGIAAGADKVYEAFVEEIKKRNLDIQIKKCGCQGMCYSEPSVEVRVKGMPDVIYGKVDKEGVMKILDKHVCGNALVKDAIYELRTKR